MEKELKDQVKQLVDSLFSEKEEANIRLRTEEELEKSASTIASLTTELETKNSEISEIKETLSTIEASKTALETELEAARAETEVAKQKVVEVEKELEDISKDRAAEKRMVELEDAGVARSDKETQMTKVREMSDEEFASYKDELVSIRESVVKELEKARQEADAKAEADKVAAKAAAVSESNAAEGESSEEASEEEASEEEAAEQTPPAAITPGQAAMASLNMEYRPSSDIVERYAKLGEALAEKFKK